MLRALRDLGRWWFLWATAGARPYATLTPRTSSRRFLDSGLFARSSKKEDVLPCPHFYSALSPRDAQHVTPPSLAPSGLTSAPRGLNWSHLTQAPDPRANPQGKDKLLNNYINFYSTRPSFKEQFRLNTREATNLQSIINTFSEATQGACNIPAP